jgi:hypothetical protein
MRAACAFNAGNGHSDQRVAHNPRNGIGARAGTRNQLGSGRAADGDRDRSAEKIQSLANVHPKLGEAFDGARADEEVKVWDAARSILRDDRAPIECRKRLLFVGPGHLDPGRTDPPHPLIGSVDAPRLASSAHLDALIGER